MKTAIAGLGLGLVLSAGAEISTFENAAYDYWKASALIQEVLTADQFDYALFAERELPNLPPKVFSHQPQAGRWLLNERLMLEALHAGAGKPRCVFLPEGQATAQQIALYRGSMSRVIRRALASAKAHEFVENLRAAASIYADLLRLLRHMDEDGDWAATDFSLTMLPPVLGDLAGFLSRRPPRDAVELITRELDAASSPRFPIRRLLEQETRAYAEWLTEDPALVEARIGGLYGAAIRKPALTELLPLDPPADLARVREWLVGYRDEVGRLAEAVVLPYEPAIRAIREIDGRIAGVGEPGGEGPANPLLPLLMPPMAATYERFVAGEAHLAMIEVLAKAAIYGDFVGEWPDRIDVLNQFAGEVLPLDPFTGEMMGYDLRGDLPRVRVEAPKSVLDAGAVTEINLRQRVQEDEEALASHIRELQRRQRAAEATAGNKDAERAASGGRGASGGLSSPVRRGP